MRMEIGTIKPKVSKTRSGF